MKKSTVTNLPKGLPRNISPFGKVQRGEPHLWKGKPRTMVARDGKIIYIHRGLDHITAKKLSKAAIRRQGNFFKKGRWAQ